MRTVADREKDDFGSTDDVLERNIADPAALGRDPAVEGIVAVVAHHEEMAGRHHVGLRVVVLGVFDAIEGVVS